MNHFYLPQTVAGVMAPGAVAGPAFTPGVLPGMPPSDEIELDERGLPRRRLRAAPPLTLPEDNPLMMQPPFGGFRANGGPVMPGFQYFGGENGEELLTDGERVQRIGTRGPEMFTPTKPGVVIPFRPPNQRVMPSAHNPITGQESSFDGMSRTEFFGGAMKRGLGGTGPAGGSVPVYGEIRQEASGQTPRADPRSFGPGGMNFSGPPAPPRAAATGDPRQMAGTTTGGPGMLVPGPSGSYKWQPGTGTGTTPPPQMDPRTMPQNAPMMFGMSASPPGPMLIRSGAKTMNANQSGSLSGRGTHGEQTGPLSLRLPVPKGRSGRDPRRIAEQMARGIMPRGDPRALMQFGMMDAGQDFARERDAVNFNQGLMMFGMQQGSMDARDARNFDQQQQMDAARWAAMSERDKQNFLQQQQLETERRAAEERERARVPHVQMQPLPGTNYALPIADGRAYGPVPTAQPDKPVPKGLVPKAANVDGIQYGVPDEPAQPKFTYRDLPGEMTQDPVTKAWRQLPGQTVRIHEDGTYEPIQPRAKAGESKPDPAATSDPKARLNAIRAKAGLPPL